MGVFSSTLCFSVMKKYRINHHIERSIRNGQIEEKEYYTISKRGRIFGFWHAFPDYDRDWGYRETWKTLEEAEKFLGLYIKNNGKEVECTRMTVKEISVP